MICSSPELRRSINQIIRYAGWLTLYALITHVVKIKWCLSIPNLPWEAVPQILVVLHKDQPLKFPILLVNLLGVIFLEVEVILQSKALLADVAIEHWLSIIRLRGLLLLLLVHGLPLEHLIDPLLVYEVEGVESHLLLLFMHAEVLHEKLRWLVEGAEAQAEENTRQLAPFLLYDELFNCLYSYIPQSVDSVQPAMPWVLHVFDEVHHLRVAYSPPEHAVLVRPTLRDPKQMSGCSLA